YAIFNSSNVREFIYGMNGTAKITVSPLDFSPEDYLHEWVERHFSSNQDEICQCYRDYFGAFEKNAHGVAICNDGLMIHRCNQSLQKIIKGDRGEAVKTAKPNMFFESLSDMFPDVSDMQEHLQRLERQEDRMMDVQRRAKALQASLPQEEASFLYAQLIYPSGLYRYFCRCEHECQLALCAFQKGDDETMKSHLAEACHVLKEYESLIPAYLTGQYVRWYDGCQKVDYRPIIDMLQKLLGSI
ncbi:MAG: hypothetical protein J5743_01700, partial [Victivallales bacterium]|nr:hypothetical protein [Victivallales bacterium]